MSTPLILAIDYILDEDVLLAVVQMLIGFDANPNLKGKFGWTPLIYASQNGQIEVVQTLL